MFKLHQRDCCYIYSRRESLFICWWTWAACIVEYLFYVLPCLLNCVLQCSESNLGPRQRAREREWGNMNGVFVSQYELSLLRDQTSFVRGAAVHSSLISRAMWNNVSLYYLPEQMQVCVCACVCVCVYQSKPNLPQHVFVVSVSV